jgi:tetratricopeptide (TPR) repeat protein
MLKDPPTPKQRLDGLVDTRETVAMLRSTTPPILRKELGGDLDWIVTRAMEKDRSRRYETAVGLAFELERNLAFEPVQARGTGAAYRLRRFVRRNRVGVGFGSTVVVGLVAFAITSSIQADRIARARDEAEVRRDQAEGLIDFMLNDLREKLEPIGRLDVLGDVGDQATAYFGSLPESEFTEDELLSRSQALYQLGAVRLDEGSSDDAETAFRESLRLSKALVDRDPRNAERLYGVSQSHFWVGYVAWLQGDLGEAEGEFQSYLTAAQTMVELQPDNLDYRLELGYAHSNIGSVREARGDLEGAIDAFSRTLAVKQDLVRGDPSNLDWLGELAETHNHLGVVYRRLGAYDRALEQHAREHELKTELLERDPTHAGWRHSLAMALTFLAGLQQETGELELAAANQRQTIQILDSLAAYDPSNTRWRRDAAVAYSDLGKVLIGTGRTPAALELFREARLVLDDLLRTDSIGFGWRQDLGGVQTALARALLDVGRPAEALAVAEVGRSLLALEPTPERNFIGQRAYNEIVLGLALAAVDRGVEAEESLLRALAMIEELVAGPGGVEFSPLLAEALLALDRPDEARSVLQGLWARGYADPYLARLAAEKDIIP